MISKIAASPSSVIREKMEPLFHFISYAELCGFCFAKIPQVQIRAKAR
jgi:hypothetical protein